MQEKTFQILSSIREDAVSPLAYFPFYLYIWIILAPLQLRTNDFKPYNSKVWNYFLLHESSLIKSSFINKKTSNFL